MRTQNNTGYFIQNMIRGIVKKYSRRQKMTEVVSVNRRNGKAVTAAGLLAAALVFGLALLGCTTEDELKNKFYTVRYEVTSTGVDLDTVTIETGTNNTRKLNPGTSNYHSESVNVEIAPYDWLYLAVSATGKANMPGSITARITVGGKVVDERTANTFTATNSGQPVVFVQARYSLEYDG
jgi:hypothetical protein